MASNNLVPSLMSRALSVVRGLRATEKSLVSTEVGVVDTGWEWNFWQTGRHTDRGRMNSVCEAAIATTAQTVATCPIYHLRATGSGGEFRVTTSALSRLFHRPNDYWSRSDFFLNTVTSLYKDGNAYVYIGDRNDRNEPKSMHLLNPRITRGHRLEDGTIVYTSGRSSWDLKGDIDFDSLTYIPARDMVHIKLETPYDPLRGVSPIQAIGMSIMANNAIMGHEAAFFSNMSRPSGVLSTENALTKQQLTMLREAWAERSQGLNTGEVPILSNGLKWYPLSLSSQDSQVVEALKFTVEDISRAFRVPLPLLNAMEGATFNNAESMLNWWLASGLGFVLDHIESAFAHAFNIPPTERLNFDTNILLRSDFKSRIEALGSAVLRGIYSPNEARAREGLDAVEEGEEPRVQQQVVPLSYYADQQELEREKLRVQQSAAEAAAEREEEDDNTPEDDPDDGVPDDPDELDDGDEVTAGYDELVTKLNQARELAVV